MKVTGARVATTTLYGTAIALVLFGLWMRIAPPVLRATPVAQQILPAIDERVAAAEAVPSEQIWAPVVAGNIFSLSRQAPARMSPAPQATADASARPRPHSPALTLYGTTVGPDGAIALIRGEAVSPGVEVYHLGDVVAGMRIVEITDSTVTFVKPSGPMVLHLQPAGHSKL
jgi:hypothetical protein